MRSLYFVVSGGRMSLEFWPQMLNLICCFKVINYLRRYNFWRDYFKKQKHSVGRVEEQGIFSSLKVFKIRPNGWIKGNSNKAFLPLLPHFMIFLSSAELPVRWASIDKSSNMEKCWGKNQDFFLLILHSRYVSPFSKVHSTYLV